MKNKVKKIASILAFIIGAMAVFAGGRVLIGIDPGYHVIDWLLIYNFTMGLVTCFLTAVMLWRNSKYALTAAVATLSIHSLIMIILQTFYRSVVAPDSIQAMTIRIVVWIVILSLLLFPSLKNLRRNVTTV